jgi:hypothetical protein
MIAWYGRSKTNNIKALRKGSHFRDDKSFVSYMAPDFKKVANLFAPIRQRKIRPINALEKIG